MGKRIRTRHVYIFFYEKYALLRYHIAANITAEKKQKFLSTIAFSEALIGSEYISDYLLNFKTICTHSDGKKYVSVNL